MYLSRLELHGFKSFSSRTILDFAPGVTAIVGPNGCGKSNVVDAVRWVIGEQRARVLRSDKMENVIFNGTVKKRPLGMAEVLLTIENTRGVLPIEYTEITIGRRLYRSGESEYLLNGTQCRLKDIADLFMDTGMGAGAYSVIELKMIEDILSESAQDRRHLFEEAAGITKYKIRRAQTLRKLESTRVDLTRISDLVDEIEKRVRSLKRQAGKAARFKELQGRLHRLELGLGRLEFDRLSGQEVALKSEIGDLRQQMVAQNAEHSGLEAEMESLRTTLIGHEHAYASLQADLNRHVQNVRSLESEQRLQRELLDAADKDLERSRHDEAEAVARLKLRKEEIERFTAEILKLEPEVGKADETLAKVKGERDQVLASVEVHRHVLVKAQDREREVADLLSDRLRAMDRLSSRRDLLEQDKQLLEEQYTDLEVNGSDIGTRVTTARSEEARARKATEEARIELTSVERKHAQLAEALESTRSELHLVERERESVLTEVRLLESLVSSYEDFSAAVQHLASTQKDNKELVTVAHLFSCKEEMRPALDAALGAFAACIVVSSTSDARDGMSRLKQAGKGKATFLVLDRMGAAADSAPVAFAPVGTPLLDHVSVVDDQYRAVARLLLANVFVVEAKDHLDGGKPSRAAGYVRYISRQGDWIDSRGFFHGGSVGTEEATVSKRLARRERLEASRQRLSELETAISRLEGQCEDTRAQGASLPLGALRKAVQDAERKMAEAERDALHAHYEQDAVDKRRRDIRGRLDGIAESVTHITGEIERLRQGVSEMESALEEVRRMRAAAENAFHDAEASGREALSRHSDANVALIDVRNRFDVQVRERTHAAQAVEELNRQSSLRLQRRQELLTQMEECRRRLSEVAALLSDAESAYPDIEGAASASKDAVMHVKSAISDLESALREKRRARELSIREENIRAVRLAEIQTRLDDLTQRIQEDFGIDVCVHEGALDDDRDEQTVRSEVVELRNAIRAMGPVNELALQEYEEERRRLTFLTDQYGDLQHAEDTLVETIEEINQTASTRFNETFAGIRENFVDLFARLFGDEATANLLLEDPGDPLESPIEVLAKPRGKRPSILNQLSGGEKTLTAIALLFAIYLVKPSPFCILDEVDAPLDDANISRFMQLIRDFAQTTQFILVTHNKKTMEAADRMYGITMQEQGVSRLVGVKFDEAVAATAP